MLLLEAYVIFMLHFTFLIFYLFLCAVVFAVVEIQIEGPHGWAQKLPAWRPHPQHWLSRLTKRVFHGKEFTGYHASVFLFLLLVFHFPFVWSGTWSVFSELELLAVFAVFVVVWDFLWFVLNPYYSLRNFNPQNVWWHKRWIGRVPVEYVYGVLFACILYTPLILSDSSYFFRLMLLFVGNAVLIGVVVMIYPRARQLAYLHRLW